MSSTEDEEESENDVLSHSFAKYDQPGIVGAVLNLRVHQINVKSAFLNGYLTEGKLEKKK